MHSHSPCLKLQTLQRSQGAAFHTPCCSGAAWGSLLHFFHRSRDDAGGAPAGSGCPGQSRNVTALQTICALHPGAVLPRCQSFLLPWESSRKLWRLGAGRRSCKLKQGCCGLEQAEVLGDPAIASLDLSGLFSSAGCCNDWRREIASSGYVVGFGKGFSTAFVMFKGGCCSQIKLE